MEDPPSFDSTRMDQLGLPGVFIAAILLWGGMSLTGLAGFALTMAALGTGAVSIGLLVAHTANLVSTHGLRTGIAASRQHGGGSTAPAASSRCGLCRRRRVRVGDIALCPRCDRHHMP